MSLQTSLTAAESGPFKLVRPSLSALAKWEISFGVGIEPGTHIKEHGALYWCWLASKATPLNNNPRAWSIYHSISTTFASLSVYI